MAGTQVDGTFRRHARGHDVATVLSLGTFAPYGTVHENSLIKIDEDLPLNRACLIGCGITTGWGSAVNSAEVRPGDTVVVIGCGGVGAVRCRVRAWPERRRSLPSTSWNPSATRFSSSAPPISASP